MKLYPYSAPSEGFTVEHYRYSPFHGYAFLAAWRETRREPLPPPRADSLTPACVTESKIAGWRNALNKGELTQSNQRDIESLLRNYEAKKKIFADYNAGFTSKGRTDIAPLSCWLAFCELLLALAERTSALPPLNAALKLNDTLLARARALSSTEQQRLRDTLAHEQRLVDALARSAGVDIV